MSFCPQNNIFKKNTAALTAVTLVGLTGCGVSPTPTAPPPAARYESASVSGLAPPPRMEAYDMYVTDDEYKLALYEPEEGCYAGAYILSDRSVDFDIEKFEEIVKKSHELYMYNMNLGDTFPSNWVLSCVANMKTPYVVLRTPRAMTASDWETLRETAEAFDEFYVPMFVEFNPVDVSAPPDAYTATFRKTRDIFKEAASNVAFVWSADINDIEICERYYPGGEWVDWVGIGIMESLDPDREYTGDALNGLETFCGMFQREKPIIISRFAVSRVNSYDYVYCTNSAAKEIERVYNAVATGYPRVKAIIYMDFNGMETNGNRKTRDDFTITGDGRIIDAYSRAASRSHFATGLAVSSFGDLCPQEYKSRFKVYKNSQGYFVPEIAFAEDFSGLAPPKNGQTFINGARCARVEDAVWFDGVARLEKIGSPF
jgi:hypothetical protein